MSTPDIDEILQQVASGELTPEAAHGLLTTPVDLYREPARPAAATSQTTPGASPEASPETRPTATVRIHASYRAVDVIADAQVRELAVEGKHTVHRDGDVLVVETTESPFAGFEPRAGWAGTGTRFSFEDLPRGLAWARSFKDQRLVVRVNPAVAVEIDGAGTSMRLRGLAGGTRVRAAASSVTLDDLRGRLDVDAFTSSIKGRVTVTGNSRLACESSSVKLTLAPGSDVTIAAHNRMGKVVLPQAVSTAGLLDVESATDRVGDGSGRLDIEALMSSVTLTTEAPA